MSTPLPPLVAERLRALRMRPIDPVEKGAGSLSAHPSAAHLSVAELAATRPRLHAAGFTYPLLTLRESALEQNLAAMAAYCAAAGVELAPHGKTAMSPELAARQLSHGAWAITVATIGQLRTYRTFGFGRLLLANQLTDEAGIGWLAAELDADPEFEALCYVDSLEGVARLDRVLSSCRAGLPASRRLPVLVEIGHDGGRTGCRTDEAAMAVAKAAAATSTLTVAGAAGYEGTISAPSQAGTEAAIAAFCRRLRALAGALALAGHAAEGELIVTAGGSAFFDVVTRELTAGGTGQGGAGQGGAGQGGAGQGGQVTAVLRSGAYLTHDHGFYGTVSPAARGTAGAPALRPALELWAQVLSRPEPGLALLGAGRRDAGFDKGLPVPLRVVPHDGQPSDGQHRDGQHSDGEDRLAGEVTELNDQHAYLRLDPDTVLGPGDLVSLGISHPCTTLDKWRIIPVVDDGDWVIDAVHSFF
jgi:D-serine deaminase-like pyridoxal phosphate-dependent protein